MSVALDRTPRARPLERLWWERLWWAMPGLTTVALALPTLGRQPLSWDEAVTADVAGRSVPGILGVIRHTDSPLTLYYLLMHVWIRLGDIPGVGFGQEVWLRLPSLAMAAVASCLLCLLVARWASRRVAVLAGVLLAVHPMLQFYAQDARPYTAAAAAVIGSVWLADRAILSGSRRSWTWWVSASVLVGYVHLFALPAALVASAGVAVSRRSRPPWPTVLVALGAVVIAVLPLVVLGAGQTGEVGWIPSAGVVGVIRVLVHACGGVGTAVAWTAVAVSARQRGFHRGSPVWWSWLLVPPVLLVLADLAVPVLVARYLLVCVPAACVLVALAVHESRSRVLLAVVVAASLVTVAVQDSASFKYADYRAVADRIGDRLHPGDGVLYTPIATRVGVARYAGLEPDTGALIGADVSRAGGSAPSLAGAVAPAAVVARRLAAARRVFVIGDPGSIAGFRPPRGRRAVWSQRFGVVEVVEYDASGQPGAR